MMIKKGKGKAPAQKIGVLFVREVPEEIRLLAKSRAVGERRRLRDVVMQALRLYGAGLWSPWSD